VQTQEHPILLIKIKELESNNSYNKGKRRLLESHNTINLWVFKLAFLLNPLIAIIKSLNKFILVITDGLAKEHCIAAYLFTKTVLRLVRKSGGLFVALYLKQCASSLQLAYGGDKTPLSLLPVPVSLTRSGYPRIIPRFHRNIIFKRDERADVLVQMYLSFFSLK